jgi:integrase
MKIRKIGLEIDLAQFCDPSADAGVNIREVQELLGHQSVETTMIYTHVVRTMSNRPKSPLDTL